MISVRLERLIPAPPARVYRAWLDPHLLARWMVPGRLSVARAEVDERVGGHYRIWQSDDGTDAGGFDAEVLELVPDRRITLRWGFVGPQRRAGLAFDSLLTVTFEPEGDATRLTLVHERLDELAAAMPDVAKGVQPGWESALEQLAGVLR
jgi:uncharacterized protein YndB with AHSA1/START domain